MFEEKEIEIPVGSALLNGTLTMPDGSTGLIMFAHGSGSSRFSKRNRWVAGRLQEQGFGTLLFDLLTHAEEAVDVYTRQFRFDIAMLARRLEVVTNWMADRPEAKRLPIGYFGASTGAAAALIAAAALKDRIGAVVSRGGRPDLAAGSLPLVTAPVLLIIGENDHEVIKLNQLAYDNLKCVKKIEIVAGATHLFEEPGTLEQAAKLAEQWFARHLTSGTSRSASGAI